MYDLAVIGGGVNGCGIARDAAGRGLDVVVVEKGDLAGATSSASTKLIHGGLRYLEHREFRLVREALQERAVLLDALPHIAWPLRFVLPHHRGLRPRWMIRLGLFIYDHLAGGNGGRRKLPGTRRLDLSRDAAGLPLKDDYHTAFEYSDAWVDDARLVVLNALDAQENGARILTRTEFTAADRGADLWTLSLRDVETGEVSIIRARAVVNAAGPWVAETLVDRLKVKTPERVRLVRGSHIVVPRLFDHDRAYIFQNADNRIVFAIPYEDDFTLIGTTDADHKGDPGRVAITPEEVDYLCRAVSGYFRRPVTPEMVVWTYSGVRPLYDDGASKAQEATRDYVLTVDTAAAPVISAFGGKITTYRRLAEAALAKLEPLLPARTDGRALRGPWTADAPLPGGRLPAGGVEALVQSLALSHPVLDERTRRRLARAYGGYVHRVIGDAAADPSALGEHFGAGLHAREVAWLMDHEWARTAEDVLWRRTKLGLRIDAAGVRRLDAWMQARRSARLAA
ncbi:MAG: glycerol-3-phosphate dehydrogenase [Tistrella sp.]|uniref:Glycerol-3-phosphate dehydrogenase n=1 Tax=Tistrella mobilis TaxID=171437 RepID=A0A3B9IMJ6_9PROT|nr:glycerol-3-phosphate dehydrogenase [Tistrella sp.]HAE49025.1 glycerol-3-phosphate dehydrogenase [Tistrella mobilis]